MRYCYTEKNDFVFKEGEPGSYFFVIEQGTVEVQKSFKTIRTLENGSSFGDLSLLYSAPRSTSIYCPEKSYFWALEIRVFQQVLRNIKTNQFIENRKVLNNVKFFGSRSFTQSTVLWGTAERPCNGHGCGKIPKRNRYPETR